MTKPKYVTREKRIRQLEKEIKQLKQQNQTLTNLLHETMAMLYRCKPAYGRSMERDFHAELLPSELPKVNHSYRRRRLPLLPRPDLVK